jgi:hypothetical protein
MNSKQLILGVFVVLMSINSASAKSWRGIEPMHSTSADVERLLGAPNFEKSEFAWIYDFPEERASIFFSSGEPCEEGLAEGWKLPKDTVVMIEVHPKAERKWAEVLTPGKNYEPVRAADTPHVYYLDSEDGITFTVLEDVVQSIMYGSSAKDRIYKCGEYKYAAPVAPGAKLKSMEQHAFDVFGDVSYEDAKARLDTFVIRLFEQKKEEPKWRGYIVVYAGRRSYLGEAQFKADCYKNYLVRVRKMDPASLFAADGGFREKIEVMLYLGPSDFYPPSLIPTVSPKKAQVIRRRLKSCAE